MLREFDARCITSAEDAAELLGLEQAAGPGETPSARTDDRTRVLDAMSSRTARSVDEIARHAGMAVDDVRARLGLLELDGAVTRTPSGWRSG